MATLGNHPYLHKKVHHTQSKIGGHVDLLFKDIDDGQAILSFNSLLSLP